jgi:hypothetical protein
MDIYPLGAVLWRMVGLCLAGVFSLALSGEVHGADTDSGRVDAAFEQLIAEANDLGTLKVPEHRAVFTRPHRVVSELEPVDGAAVLRRLDGKLAGDLYGDTYIRWHMLPIVHDWLHGRAVDASGDPLPADSVKATRHLFQDMPAETRARYASPLSEEGKRLEKRLVGLRAQTRVKVGVPPFEKTYSGRAALPHMTPSARRRAEPIVKQIEALQNQIKQMRSRDVDKLNDRNRELSKVFREYRCDLTYAMIQTGNEKALDDVGSAIGSLIRNRQRVGLDLMQSTYKAMHHGYLGQYSDRALASLRVKLLKAGSGAGKYERYNSGGEPVSAEVRPKMRSFGAYSTHMVGLLEEPSRVRLFTVKDSGVEGGQPSIPYGPFDPQTLSIDDIRAAIRAAIIELYTAEHQGSEAKVRAVLPHENVRHDSMYWALNRYNKGTPRYQEVVYETGNHALVCWAMLAAGQSYQDPRLNRRISWVLSSDTPYTYDRGMRLMMLSRLAGESYGPWAKRDAEWLASAVTDKGNFNSEYFGGPSVGYGDHGSGFYGVLGLWGADKLDIDLKNKKVWTPIDRHWRATQQKTSDDAAAGWAVGMLATTGGDDAAQARTKITRSTVNGPMTAAGVASLTLTERFLVGPKLTDPTRDNVSPELRKGLRWLDENFDHTQVFGADWYYYMWTTQQVGRATGRRTFNDVDWFREVTAEMLNRQGSDGLWQDDSGKQGKLLSTGFALLYLANALEPVAVSKVRFDGRWDNRPNDLWNFAEYASDVYEVDTTWQIVGLDQPMHELADTPLLYLATNEPFTLSVAKVDRLREYIDAGGMLVFNPEAPWNRLAGSVEALVEALYPGRSLEEVAGFHPFYSLHSKLRPTVQMRMAHNGVRPLVVAFTKDIGRGLQVNDLNRYGDSFAAMSNIYLFAVGTEPRRVRLETSYVAPPESWPTDKLEVARIRYDGDYDPEPGALAQLRAVVARDQGIDLVVREVAAEELADERVAFLTTAGGGALTDDEAKSLRAWVQAGGTLWLDAAGGTPVAVEAANAMLMKLFPDRFPTPLVDDSPIITGQGLGMDAHDARRVSYSQFAQRQMGETHTPRLQAITIDGRSAVIYSPEDLTAALSGVGHWGVFGYSTDSARKLVSNGILDAAR